MSGRAVDGRLVHFAPVPLDDDADANHVDGKIRPGDYVTVTVTESAPHFLIADSGVTGHRRTRAGDMWEVGNTPTTAPIGVGLGLPAVGRPSPTIQRPENQDRGCGCD